MKQFWSASELAESWTLSGNEKQLSDQRAQQGRLGLAVLGFPIVMEQFWLLRGRDNHWNEKLR